MTEIDESAAREFEPESDSESPDSPSDNPAVARCMRAWNRAYHKKLDELDKDDDDDEARKAGKLYYLRAMPPLAGSENIRDFIACVTYASLTEIILQTDAEHHFAAAKVAFSGLRHESKPLVCPPRCPSRPRKSAEEEK